MAKIMRAGILARGHRDRAIGADGSDRRPAGRQVEHRDDRDRDVGGARDRALRVAGLLGEDRRRLEAQERREARTRARCPASREKTSAGANDCSGYSPGPALTKTATMIATSSTVSSASSTPRSRTLVCTPRKHSAKTAARPTIEQTGQDTEIPSSESSAAGREEAEERPDEDHRREVGDERDVPGADARAAAEAGGDVRVEGAGVGDVAAHRRVADREQRQQQPDEQPGARRPDAVARGRWPWGCSSSTPRAAPRTRSPGTPSPARPSRCAARSVLARSVMSASLLAARWPVQDGPGAAGPSWWP